jgi:hypothetical protein
VVEPRTPSLPSSAVTEAREEQLGAVLALGELA